MRSSGPRALATLAIVGLLVIFHQVVRGAVAEGEARRKAAAAQFEVAWRCNAEPGLHVRGTCPPLLNPMESALLPRERPSSRVRHTCARCESVQTPAPLR